MKTLYKSLIAAAVLTPTLTGCIEEVFPTNGVTEDQLAASSKATEALVYAMPAYFNHYATVSSDAAYDWGYGSMMHIRDVMTEDMAIVSSGYDWYTAWEFDRYLGDRYMYGQVIWNFYNQLVLTANNLISAIDEETASDQQLVYLGMGYAYRAHHYLDLARMYEFLENDVLAPVSPDGNPVLNLTVPILTDKTTEEEARNNPRAPREEMLAFILSDLAKAEQYLQGQPAGLLPGISTVYGLYARAYMWVENYPQAAQYAAKAIAAQGPNKVMTQEEWLSTTSGFNEPTSSWMLYAQQVKEDDVVQTGILNWTSWVSNETTYGYASAGPWVMIGASTYNRISDRDFRKLAFIAPEGSALSGREPVIDASYAAENFDAYYSLKFRPGSGNMSDYNVGSATAYPLMRIEEMYFIQAEATAHSSAAEGKQLLEDFMKKFRYATYSCSASDQDGIIEEIVFQKRVELWGEGQSYFDIKRLNYPVTRYYSGTNFTATAQFNTTTRPAWMNFVIVQTEANNNEGVRGYNNPDPSNKYTAGK